jgi:hypothetical protein
MKSRDGVDLLLSRKVLAVIIVVLFIVTCTLAAQEHFSLTMTSVMTMDEFNSSGIGSLSKSQRAALDLWLNKYTAHVIRIITKADATTDSPSRGGCSPAIETTISGEFNGWEGETIFKLSNGQIWQQAEYSYTYSYAYMPEVTIYSTSSGCRMKVEDEEETILVKRLK